MFILKKCFLKNVALVFALLSTLLLTACGGGGGGGGGNSGITINDAMVGTWYLNFEDGKPVVPNAQGKVDTMILKSDGTCKMTTYDLSNRDHPTYWETVGTGESNNGTWGYANGRMYTTVDGVSMNFPVSLDNDALTITGTYEDSTETWIDVYKKTKYSL